MKYIYLVTAESSWLGANQHKVFFPLTDEKDSKEKRKHNRGLIFTSILYALSPIFGGLPATAEDIANVGTSARLLDKLATNKGYTGGENNNFVMGKITPDRIFETVPSYPDEKKIHLHDHEKSEAYQLAEMQDDIVSPMFQNVYIVSSTTPAEALVNGLNNGVIFNSLFDAKGYAKFERPFQQMMEDLDLIEKELKENQYGLEVETEKDEFRLVEDFSENEEDTQNIDTESDEEVNASSEDEILTIKRVIYTNTHCGFFKKQVETHAAEKKQTETCIINA